MALSPQDGRGDRRLRPEKLHRGRQVDHLVFKFRIYLGLFGLQEVAPDQVASHTACRLGKWYFSRGRRPGLFQRPAHYRELEAPPQAVHRPAWQPGARGQNDVDAMLRHTVKMEEASQAVLDHLQRMAEAGRDDQGCCATPDPPSQPAPDDSAIIMDNQVITGDSPAANAS